MEVCSVTFDASGSPQTSGPVRLVSSSAAPAAPPDNRFGAIQLGPDSTLEVEIDPALLGPDLALAIVLKVDDSAGALVTGGLDLTLTTRPGGLTTELQLTTADGTVATGSESAGYVATWHRAVVAYAGGEVLFATNDVLAERVVLTRSSRATPPTGWVFGGSPLRCTLAAVHWYAAVPEDLVASAAAARARGDGELLSLARSHQELAGIEEIPETFEYACRKVSHPEAELIWHRATGAHLLTGRIRELWLAHGAERGQLGFPLTDVIDASALCAPWLATARPHRPGSITSAPFVGTGARFEDGVVIADAATAIMVTGEILLCWRALGGTAGVLGAPAEPEVAVAEGLSQRFAGGVIYWRSGEGAHPLTGAVLLEYQRRDGPAALGFPRADPMAAPEGGGTLLTCTGGTLHLPDGGGPSLWMSTAMYQAWASSSGKLGPAEGDEVVRPSGVRALRCAQGVLVASEGLPPIPVTSLELTLLDAFVPEADDGITFIGGDETAELIVETTVEVRHADTLDEVRDVTARETDDDRRVDLAVRPFVVSTVDESTSFRIICRAWDHDTLSANDELGGIDETWHVDNEWGLRHQLAGVHESKGTGGDGVVRYRYTLSAPGIDPTTLGPAAFRELLWWPFDNFSTPRLDHDLFVATFEDVSAMADLNLKDALVEIFFNAAFTSAAAGGNCYGMSREGLLGLAGRAPWRPPLSRLRADRQGSRRGI